MRALRGVVTASLVLAVAGCESVLGLQDHPLADDLTYFTGSEWKGSATNVETCPGTAPESATNSYEILLTDQGPSNITFVNAEGCTIEFVVSGNTATMINAPATCSTTTDAGIAVVTYLSYTLTSMNGLELSGSSQDSITLDGDTCTFTSTITAAR